MPRQQKLKVYRTPIGFHDAYVAAPSQKAALEAWGTSVNLFARGVAETVTDEALAAEPLARPGEVIKRLRGSAEEQIAALPPDRPKKKKAAKPDAADAPEAAEAPRPRPPKPAPKPRPSRAALDEAEKRWEELLKKQEAEEDDLRRRERALERERRELHRTQERERRSAEQTVEEERKAHAEALSRWRADS